MSKIQHTHRGFIPYLVVKDAHRAMDMYLKAFGGIQGPCLRMKDGTVAHAEVCIGDSRLMLSEEKEEWNMKGPKAMGGCPLTLTLYVEDVDEVVKQAEAAGMKIIRALENQFFGDRMATLEDPYGYIWSLGTKIEEVSEEEMQNRMTQIYEPES